MNEFDDNELNPNKKQKTIHTISLSLIILTVVIGISYALFYLTQKLDLLTITSQDLTMEFAEGDNSITATGIPIYDEDAESDASYLIFSIENTSKNPIYMDIYLQNISMTSEVFKSEDFKWSLEEGSGLTEESYSTNISPVSNGNFLNIDETDSSNKNIIIAKGIRIEAGTTKYYKVRIWLSENMQDQTAFMGESFSATVGVKGNGSTQTILASESPILTNTIANAPITNLKLSGRSYHSSNVYSDGDISFTATKRLTLSNPIEPGTYTVSALFDNDSDTYNSGLIFYAGSSGSAIGNIGYKKDDINRKTVTFNETIYTLIFYATNAGSTNAGVSASFRDIQIYKEPTPDNPTEIQSVGDLVTDESDSNYGKYKIPITVSGKNLLNINEYFSDYITSSNEISFNYTNFRNIYSKKLLQGKFEENTQYTISFDYEISNSSGNGIFVYCTYTDGTGQSQYFDTKWKTTSQVTGSQSGTVNFTSKADATINTIAISYSYGDKSCDVKLKNMQIEKGTSATSYEPYQQPITTTIYLDEPLRKIGNVEDYIDFASGTVVRNLTSYVFDGSDDENWILNRESDTKMTFYINCPNNDENWRDSLLTNSLSSHFTQGYNNSVLVTNNSEAYCAANTTNFLYIGILKSRLVSADLAGVKKWLSGQYSNGNPFNVVVQSKTPETQNITLPQIKTLSGTTILSADTTIKPIFSGNY